MPKIKKINWAAAAVILPAVIAIGGGLWTVFIYFESHQQTDELRVCRADKESNCSPHDRFLRQASRPNAPRPVAKSGSAPERRMDDAARIASARLGPIF